MAEASAVAFGRYLRALRERRGLSLHRVCQLTGDLLDKGALSRLERGQQVPSIFKLGPLSRVYEVSPEALIERMELDREVERLGRPSTEGKTYEELHRFGGAALVRDNRKWEAYAYFRDALPLAGEDKRIPAWCNLVTAIRSLGKNALALHELSELQASGELAPAQRALVHERMSNCHRCLGDMRRAEECAESAAAQAIALGDSRTLAFAYTARANAALNGLSNIEWRAVDAFEGLRAMARAREQFDTIVLDPPAFAKTRASVPDAIRGYREINLRAMRCLAPGGILLTASCSFHVRLPAFLAMLAEAAGDSGRRIRVCRILGQGEDHPEVLTIPETGYLKGALLEAE